MAADQQRVKGEGALVLGIDTCGPSGSVALARISGVTAEILGEAQLEGRTYSATLVAAVDALFAAHGVPLGQLGCIVVVNGPGSFTGIRVGVSAAKGLAEGAGIPLLAVSRLAVMAHSAELEAAALDAHRREVFLRIGHSEMLAGSEELTSMQPVPARLAVCDDAAAALLASAWPGAELVRRNPPTAIDAILLAIPRLQAGSFDDTALLDGHYVRRSDAEIFGAPASSAADRSA